MRDTESFRASLAAIELVGIANERRLQKTMLDVGSGHGVHSRFFRSEGFDVDKIDKLDAKDVDPDIVFSGDFLDYIPNKKYNYLWSSHVLQHVQDMGSFIRKAIECTNDLGVIAITVPPLKSEMTFGHVTLWNPGLLLINLIKCGIDCRNARLKRYGYNISIIVENKRRDGDNLASFLPEGVEFQGNYFDGEIDDLGFVRQNVPKTPEYEEYADLAPQQIEGRLKGTLKSGFVLSRKANNPGPRFYWWDASVQRIILVS